MFVSFKIKSYNILIKKTHLSTKCTKGSFGVNCSEECVGYCRDNNLCNHVTGLCDNGCASGWTGYMCDEGWLFSWN